MRFRRQLSFVFAGLVGSVGLPLARAQAPEPAPAPAPSTDALYEMGKQLFDQLAPPEIKAEYEFPSKEQWDAFAARLQQALQNDSLEDLALYVPEARAALVALRALPGYADYANWLEQRIDEVEGASEAVAPPKPSAPPRSSPSAPIIPPTSRPPSPSAGTSAIPHYDLWLRRVRERPLPRRANELLPNLRRAFVAEGVPPELVWLAEAESTFDPTARSPVGARGLFQLMPETARALGLRTTLPDERTDPQKSARAAARYLRELHGKFGAWPLALAAYNAGEGRVSRALKARGASDFAGVASALPAETRMYVPKVSALLAVRAGVPIENLPPPRVL